MNDLEVATAHLQTILIKGANSSYSETFPLVKKFMDQYANPINPAKRTTIALDSIAVTIRTKSIGIFEIDFLTMLPDQTEWSGVSFTWLSPTDRKPIICANWNQLVSANNRRRGDNKHFYALPQEMFKPLYETFYEYRRRQSGYL